MYLPLPTHTHTYIAQYSLFALALLSKRQEQKISRLGGRTLSKWRSFPPWKRDLSWTTGNVHFSNQQHSIHMNEHRITSSWWEVSLFLVSIRHWLSSHFSDVHRLNVHKRGFPGVGVEMLPNIMGADLILSALMYSVAPCKTVMPYILSRPYKLSQHRPLTSVACNSALLWSLFQPTNFQCESSRNSFVGFARAKFDGIVFL